jgi:predicted RNase H-like nuclease (RuvC/YqgF family)
MFDDDEPVPAPKQAAQSATEWVAAFLDAYQAHYNVLRPLIKRYVEKLEQLAARCDAAEERAEKAEAERNAFFAASQEMEVDEARIALRLAVAQAELGQARERIAELETSAESLILAMETVRLDRTLEDDGNVWALQTLEWAEWLMEKATEARATLTTNPTNQ